jgi:hypothetical protein
MKPLMNVLRYLAIVLIATLFAGFGPPIALFNLAKPFGASATLSQLADMQEKNPERIFLPFDLRYNGDFKLNRIERERPEVLCISTSRAGTLEAAMFKPYHFYNMSFTAWTTDQLADMFERATRDVHPRVVIISLDYFLFTNDWERGYSGTRTMIYDQPWRYFKSSIADFARTAMKNQQVFKDYLKSPSAFTGTQAILSQEGFRGDGSYVYSSGHINDARLHYQTAASLVNSMPGAPSMSERQKAPIVRIADLARQRGIKLIGIQLPFIRSGVDYIDQDQSYRWQSGVWREFESDQTRDWLKGLGITFFDLARSTIDDDKRNFVDAYHTSRLGALRVTQQLLTFPEFRADFPDIDPAELARQIEQSDAQ